MWRHRGTAQPKPPPPPPPLRGWVSSLQGCSSSTKKEGKPPASSIWMPTTVRRVGPGRCPCQAMARRPCVPYSPPIPQTKGDLLPNSWGWGFNREACDLVQRGRWHGDASSSRGRHVLSIVSAPQSPRMPTTGRVVGSSGMEIGFVCYKEQPPTGPTYMLAPWSWNPQR